MEDKAAPKICPMCAEPIRAAAKICPHCRSWQKRWSLANPAVGGTLYALFFVLLMIGVGLAMEKVFGPKQPFSDHAHEIAVLSSQFTHRIAGSNVYVAVVGVLTNQGSYSWKNVGVEARFFDKDGNLIDAISPYAEYGGVTLLRNREAAFKLEGKAVQPQTNYASHRVFVRSAKDFNTWP